VESRLTDAMTSSRTSWPDSRKLLWLIVACAAAIGVAACGSGDNSTRHPPEQAATKPALSLDGPPIRLQLDAVSLCVGRRYIEPVQLEGLLEANQSVLMLDSRAPTRSGTDVQLFGTELRAATDELYSQLVQVGIDKQRYPADWVRVSFIPPPFATKLTRPLAERLQEYEAGSSIDREFRSHRRDQSCPGKKHSAGCCIGVEEPPECVDYTLKYGHPMDPDVVLMCTTKRCYVKSPLAQAGVHYQYDFPIGMLDAWPALHTGIRSRVEQWRGDQSCVGS
jgi:hypothetical protein